LLGVITSEVPFITAPSPMAQKVVLQRLYIGVNTLALIELQHALSE
jgi:hypothetical protein